MIESDLMALFQDFHQGNINLFSFNFGMIVLLLKKEDTSRIQEYRPICLLNVSFKILTKVATNRITSIT